MPILLVVMVALSTFYLPPASAGCRYGSRAEVHIGAAAKVCLLETTLDEALELDGVKAHLGGGVHVHVEETDHILSLAPNAEGSFRLIGVEMSRLDDHRDSTAAWLARQLVQWPADQKWRACTELLLSGTKVKSCRHAAITTADGRRFGTTVGTYLSSGQNTPQQRLVVVRIAE